MNWINVNDETPPETTGIIMWILEDNHWVTGYLYGKDLYRTGSNKKIPISEVSHWFIPEPPTK